MSFRFSKRRLRALIEKAREFRQDQTEAEELLWCNLRNRKLQGIKFRRQHPFHGFILDFYCAEKRLCIEVDGGIHLRKENREYDIARTEILNEYGVEVMRFTNGEILNDMSQVLKMIREKTVDN